MEKYTKQKIFSSVIWKFAERIGAQGVNLLVSIALARILLPEEYGIVALVMIFINISNVLVEGGLATALIQKKDTDNLDFSTVFYCNIVLSIIVYIILFYLSPMIANFYNNEQLILIIRVLSITVLIAGLKSIQNAYVSKKMIFKKFFYCTLTGTVLSAILGIWMAYKGYGVWSLVIQQLTNTIIDTLMLWIIVKWRPIFMFSFSRLKVLFKFGWKLLCSNLIDVIYNELYGLTIGKVYKPDQLAFYNKANQFPNAITVNINGSISSVMLPALSNEQDNKEKVKSMMKQSIKISSYILFPIMLILAASSESFISIILTTKWLPSAILMKLLCFAYILWPIHTINLQAISALGRSDIFLKLEIEKKIIGIIAIIISIPFGIKFMVIMKIITSLLSTFINSKPNKKLLNYGLLEQIKDILPSFIIALIVFAIVSIMNIIQCNLLFKLIIQVFTGVTIYIIISHMFNVDEYTYLKKLIAKRIGEKNK